MRGPAIVVLALVAGAAPVRAEPAQLVAARTAYAEGRQERTIALVTPLLPALGEHERASALRLVGCSHMVIGDRAAAIATFRQAFALEPDAALEPRLASPDARSLYELARGEWRAELVTEMANHTADLKRLRLDVSAPATARGARPLPIRVHVTDPARLGARLELAYRRRGTAGFALLTERLVAPDLVFSIPSDVTETAAPIVLEYHVVLRHETGFDLSRFGDADHPRTIAIAPGHRPRWHESWWARGAIAAGVIGLAAGGYFIYRSIDVGGQPVVIR